MTSETKIRYELAGLCQRCGKNQAESGKYSCLSCLIKGRARAKKRNKLIREKRYKIILEAKSKPCIDCGIVLPPSKMQFDHVRGQKFFTPSAGFNTEKEIIDEIAKCEIRCKSCHQTRHWRERQLKDGRWQTRRTK